MVVILKATSKSLSLLIATSLTLIDVNNESVIGYG